MATNKIATDAIEKISIDVAGLKTAIAGLKVTLIGTRG